MKKTRIIFLFLTALLFLQGCMAEKWFTTHKTENNLYEWTLTSRLGQALILAEEKYGERDLSWTVLGVEIYDKIHSRTFYLNHHKGKKQIIIQLSRYSLTSEANVLKRLGHEVIHVMSPGDGLNGVTVFEEGLAVYFSLFYLKRIGKEKDPEGAITDKAYAAAYTHVAGIYDAFPDADARIKALRLRAKSFYNITPEAFKTAFPGFAESFYTTLASECLACR